MRTNLRGRGFEREFKFKTSRSSGPGGQSVNKTETRVELIFDVNASVILHEAEKKILLEKLQGKLDEEGLLKIASQESRSQIGNKEKAIAKFYDIVGKALKPKKKRIPTKIPAAVKEKIKKEKKVIGEKKATRSKNFRELL